MEGFMRKFQSKIRIFCFVILFFVLYECYHFISPVKPRFKSTSRVDERYSVNGISCRRRPEIEQPPIWRFWEARIPENILKNQDKPKQFPSCGDNVFPENFKSKNIDVLIVVKTAMQHKRNRIAIRETWASLKQHNGKRYFTIFLMGKSLNKTLQNDVSKESYSHGDILQCNFVDTYDSLVLKVNYLI